MIQSQVGWYCLLFGGIYVVGLAAFPSIFNNWFLCPRWGLFGPAASRLSGIGGGLTVVSMGLVHLNTVNPSVPSWLPWCLVVISVLVTLVGGKRDPLYKDAV